MSKNQSLAGKKVAILVADGFEQVELTEPRKALEAAGAKTFVVSPQKDRVQGFHHHDKGEKIDVDIPLEQARAENFDALLLPGGVINPDALRGIPRAVELVKEMGQAGKAIAAICHGPWTLIDAGLVRGRKMTSWPTLQTDLRNAGATWTDAEVVVDRGLVTSRKPDDIPAFNREAIKLFAHQPAGA